MILDITQWIFSIKLEFVFSLVAILISGYTLWDNTFRIKIDVSSGKQIDFYVGSFEHSPLQPIINMNIVYVNSGGKTAFIDDVKLLVDFRVNQKVLLTRTFVTMREIQNSIIDISELSGVNRGISEVSPIVVLGRTSVLKKYIFFPSELILQNQIPSAFDLSIKIFLKQANKWELKKEFNVIDNSNIWQDLNDTIHKSSIREIEIKYD